MNAPTARKVLEIAPPRCLMRQGPQAHYAWWSDGHLLIVKDGEVINLDADDLHRLFGFVEANRIDEQLEGGGGVVSRGPAWTKEADAQLIAMMRAGIPPREIAEEIDRTPVAIQSRCSQLRRQGIDIPHAVTGAAAKAYERPTPESPSPHAKPKPRRGRTRRPCMCCGAPFDSEGPHNRMCGRCRTCSAGPFDTPAVLRYH